MDRQDSRNIQRVLRTMARSWGYPVWMVQKIIRETIDKNWESAQADSEAKLLWDKYFPNGKPTPEEYILWLGRAQENGEEMPYLLKAER